MLDLCDSPVCLLNVNKFAALYSTTMMRDEPPWCRKGGGNKEQFEARAIATALRTGKLATLQRNDRNRVIVIDFLTNFVFQSILGAGVSIE